MGKTSFHGARSTLYKQPNHLNELYCAPLKAIPEGEVSRWRAGQRMQDEWPEIWKKNQRQEHGTVKGGTAVEPPPSVRTNIEYRTTALGYRRSWMRTLIGAKIGVKRAEIVAAKRFTTSEQGALHFDVVLLSLFDSLPLFFNISKIKRFWHFLLCSCPPSSILPFPLPHTRQANSAWLRVVPVQRETERESESEREIAERGCSLLSAKMDYFYAYFDLLGGCLLWALRNAWCDRPRFPSGLACCHFGSHIELRWLWSCQSDRDAMTAKGVNHGIYLIRFLLRDIF